MKDGGMKCSQEESQTHELEHVLSRSNEASFKW